MKEVNTSSIKEYVRDERSPIPANSSTSRVMSANKAKHTGPETILRNALWAKGIRGYRLHCKGIPGSPDIGFISKKIAVFVNGCYWHRCSYCKPHFPHTNTSFWNNKFTANIERDKRKNNELAQLGWE